MGDWNAITSWDDVSGVQPAYQRHLHWPWLRHLEEEGLLTDLLKTNHEHPPPHTRLRGHNGTSRIDRIYATPKLLPILRVEPYAVQLLDDNGAHLSDHDPVMIRLCDWTSPPPLPISCAGWTGKQIKQFRRTLSHWYPSSSDPIERMVELQAAAKSVADSIHHHRPTSHPVSRPHWKTEIKGLLRLARRNPKCFFRRVKNAGLHSLKRANPPLQPGLLESLLHADPPSTQPSSRNMRFQVTSTGLESLSPPMTRYVTCAVYHVPSRQDMMASPPTPSTNCPTHPSAS